MAMVQNHYEISVSKHKKHWFSTAERSAINYSDAVALVQDFRKRFPEDEGYEISVSEIHCYGEGIKIP